MSSPSNGTAVALLLGGRRENGDHLRETLTVMGASIVYESATNGLDRDALARSQAKVVVVNLDGDDDPAIEAVYALLEDERYQVVFNDAEVSRDLSGWDHARWVRHLAAKIFGDADIDPPRPAGAASVPAPAPGRSGAAPSQGAEAATGSRAREPGPPAIETALPVDASIVPDARVFGVEAGEVANSPAASTTNVEEAPATGAAGNTKTSLDPLIELDAPLLSAADFAFEFETADPGSRPEPDNAAATAVPDDRLSLDFDFDHGLAAVAAADAAMEGELRELPTMDFDLDLDFDQVIEMPEPAPLATAAPPDWALEDALDDPGDLPASPADAPGAGNFGIETVSPAEYLAPPIDPDARQEPMHAASGLSLELIPLEEAVAPSAADALDHENWLDPDKAPKAKVRRVWVLGASIGGPESVREFLGELPRDYPALFLLAQHMGDEFVDTMIQQLARSTALTVRMPGHGERAGHGEVLVVPNAQRLLVDPNGVVVLERAAADMAYRPSIDRVLQDVADRFGADAGAIIFSGMSDDAVEGCRHLAAKGGSVYAQDPDTCVVSTMIDGVRETGVVTFLGSPKELATKLMAERA